LNNLALSQLALPSWEEHGKKKQPKMTLCAPIGMLLLGGLCLVLAVQFTRGWD
jgi:hypothetical protein